MNKRVSAVLLAGLSLLCSCSTNRKNSVLKEKENTYTSQDTTHLSTQKNILISDSTEYTITHVTFFNDTTSQKRRMKDVTLIKVNNIKKNSSTENNQLRNISSHKSEQKKTTENKTHNRSKTNWLRPLAILIILFTIIIFNRKL